MSPREQLQERIYQWLSERIDTFHAPYGVLTGLHTPESGRGKVRTITFGCARTLDACLYIWSPNRLDLRTNREDVSFKSEQEFYKYCREKYLPAQCKHGHLDTSADECARCLAEDGEN